jgi:hypothetical protein
MSATKNFEVDQNTTFSFVVEYKDNANLPISLVDASAKLQVRDTKGGTKLAFTLTSPNSGIIIDGPEGKLIIKMTAAQTNKLFYPKSSYDIMITDSNGNKTKLLEGFISLSRSVTI